MAQYLSVVIMLLVWIFNEAVQRLLEGVVHTLVNFVNCISGLSCCSMACPEGFMHFFFSE